MLRVAITGGIGTGKSVVLAELASCGAPVVNADALVHEALGAGMPAASAVRARFGETVIAATGDVDRARLGAIVFQDERARQDLEAILHPAVYRAIEAWMRAQERGGAMVAVAEIPLLFETGHERDFDVRGRHSLRWRGAGAESGRALRRDRSRRPPEDCGAVAARREGPAGGYRRPHRRHDRGDAPTGPGRVGRAEAAGNCGILDRLGRCRPGVRSRDIDVGAADCL